MRGFPSNEAEILRRILLDSAAIDRVEDRDGAEEERLDRATR